MRFALLIILLTAFYDSNYAQEVANKSYPYEPALDTSLNIPKGEVLEFPFNNSNIYPGTSRKYWVYIPKAYDPRKPACLYVCMDGVMFNAPAVFDYLISKKEMPVTIGVFIQSGTIMKNDGTVIRYNRTNEFDNMNDRFAKFIEDEILPDAMKQKSSDGRAIKISLDPNDHAIAGASSGAICAFTAAWQRPDLFKRVFSAIGTYIGMRGGDQYPVLIRKTEPKPLRVYLQDNNNDAWNPLFGDWFKSNIDMEAALNFAGYEVTNTWHAGGHEVKQATSIFADAMRWLWKGWPAAVKAGHSANDMLSTIAEPSEKWALSDTAIVTVKNSTLYNSILLPNGDAYLLKGNKLLFNQHKKNITLDEDANFGEALAISPGKDQLVVSIKNSHWLYNYIIDENGKVSDKQTLYWLHNPGNDDTSQIRTLAFDSDGNLYVATSIGVQVCDQNGRVRAILSLPGGTVTTLWFGGEGFNTLFAECGGKICQRKLKIAGAPSQQKTLKPKSQGGG